MHACRHCIAILALVSSCAAPEAKPAVAAAPAPLDYDTMVKTARSYAESGRPERAIELCQEASRMAPDRPEAYVVWGLSLAQQKHLDESAVRYEDAVRRGSKDRELFAELASVYDVSRRYEEAARVYRAYLALAPDDAEMHQELGLTLLLLEKFDEAIQELKTANVMRPDDLQMQQDLGYAFLRARKMADAVTVLAKVTAADPNRPEAMRMLARATAATGKPVEALKILDRVLAARPEDQRARRMRARIRLLTDDAAGANDDYRVLLSASPDDSSLLMGAAGAFIAMGNLEEADQTLDHVRQALGSHPLLEFREAQIAWRRGNKQAIKALTQFARDNANDLEAWREVHAAAKQAKNQALAAEAAEKLKALGDLL
ncbi:MAG: tetratricopeptide repeat protein [Deltaproteobacteria bacterium]|nr:tetratricopeptide repeat protein [Deltaproteobacteria bacterium]